MWMTRSSSSASAGAALEHLVRAALRPARADGDRDPLVRPVELLDRVAYEALQHVPRRRPVALEAVDQIARDEPLVEHDRLVVGAVADAERDRRAQTRVAIPAHDGVERLVAEAVELVEEVDDAGRAGAQLLDRAEDRAKVDLVRRLRRRGERGIGEQHPRLERQVVPHAAEPVLVRVVVRVDHPRDDEEAGGVDALRVGGHVGDDPPVRDREVTAPELAAADVDETALEHQPSAHDARASNRARTCVRPHEPRTIAPGHLPVEEGTHG